MVVDLDQLARSGQSMTGEAALSGCSRLAELLPHTQANTRLRWHIQGGLSHGDKRTIELTVGMDATMICQRCLELFTQAIQDQAKFTLLEQEPDALTESDWLEDCEPLAFSAGEHLLQLVEDQLLLALPAVPRHAQCNLPNGFEQDAVASPFAVLAQLHTKQE